MDSRAEILGTSSVPDGSADAQPDLPAELAQRRAFVHDDVISVLSLGILG